MRRRVLVANALSLLVLLSACNVQNTETLAVPASTASVAKSSAISGTPIPLPFENRFPNRWNPSNDGSPFEPCVAFSDDELLRFGIDPSVIEDAAIVDGQGVRGCSWFMKNRFSISSLVTNSSSLEVYRRGTAENHWEPDLRIAERTVGLFSLTHGGSTECSTYVQSHSAAVVTNVVPSTSAEGKAVDTCKLAIDFTRAYIDKIPE